MLLSLFSPIISAADELAGWDTESTYYDYEVNGDDCTVTSYRGDESVVHVPSEIDGYTVTAIGDGAFAICDDITEVYLPETVVSIGENAFVNCNNLVYVSIPDGVHTIGASAFSGCGSLTEVKIPSSLSEIEYCTFGYCYSLTNVEIPEGVEIIGSDAFTYCSSLEYVDLPETLCEIRDYAFSWCLALREMIIPDSVMHVGPCAFHDCTSMTYVKLSNSLTDLCDGTFSLCHGLSTIEIPESVQWIERGTFDASLYEIVINNPQTSLDPEAVDASTTICAHSGSYAHEYAMTYGNPFVSLGDVLPVSHVELIPPHKTTYYVGEEFDKTGLSMTVFFEDGSSIYVPEEQIEVLYFDSTNPCSHTVTFRYLDYSADYEITVIGGECLHENTVWYDEEPATCMDHGYTEGLWCDDCQTWIEGHFFISPTGDHDYWDEYVYEPTCTAHGLIRYTCDYCGDYYEEYEEPWGHDYWEDYIQEPTCTEQGIVRWTCENCGDYYEEYEEPWGHDYWDEYVQEPTCTEQGIVRWTCENCGDWYEEYEEPYDHDYCIEEIIEEATCGKEGITRWYCECGEYYDEYVYGGDDHSFDDGVVVVEPSCNMEGERHFTCLSCGYLEIEYIDYLDHNYDTVEVVTPATCMDDGEEKYICSACGDCYFETVEALGHDYVSDDMIPGTGTNPMCYPQHCQREGCGKVFCGEYYGCLAHGIGGDYVVIQEGDCTNDRIESYICADCGQNGYCLVYNGEHLPNCTGASYTNNMDETVFFYGCFTKTVFYFSEDSYLEEGCDWLYLLDADGAVVAELTGDIGGKSVTIDSHAVFLHMVTDDSNTAYGYEIERIECYNEAACIRTEAPGHQFGELTDIVEATCTEDGYRFGYCEACGIAGRYVYTSDDLPKCVGSDYVNNMYTEFTYTVDGAERIVINFTDDSSLEGGCDTISIYSGIGVNDENYIGNFTGNLGGAAVEVEGDSFTILMRTDYSVTYNGFVIESLDVYADDGCEIIEAIGHNYGEPVTSKAATCLESGELTYTCANCGDCYYEYVECLGHSFTEPGVVREATCSQTGIYGSYCTREGCDATDYEYSATLAHSFGEELVVVQEGNCTTDRIESLACTVCGTYGIEIISDESLPSNVGSCSNNMRETVTYSKPGADRIVIRFAEGSHLEEGCDWLYIYSGSEVSGENLVETLTGDLGGMTVTVEGDTFTLYTTSDHSVISHGYAVEAIECYYDVAYVITEAPGHQFGDFSVLRDVTCEEDGLAYGYCEVCGVAGYSTYEGDDLPKCTGSDYVNGMHREFTYTVPNADKITINFSELSKLENGCDVISIYEGIGVDDSRLVQTLTGEFGGSSVTVEGNSFTILMHTDSSVIYYGFEIESIEIFNEGGYEITEAFGHSYGAPAFEMEPTCTREGLTRFVCSVCGHEYRAISEALGHSYDEGVVTLEPTCAQNGEKWYTCADCGNQYVEYLYGPDHNFVETDYVPATCDADGYRTWECSSCGYSYSDTEYAFGHSFGDYTVVREATCASPQVIGYYCENEGCDAVEYDYAVGTVPHSFGDEFVTIQQGDCITDTIRSKICTQCGQYGRIVISDDTLPECTGDDYQHNMNSTFVYCAPGASQMVITFSAESETEHSCDVIYVYSGHEICDENLVATLTGYFGGTQLTIDGDNVMIVMTTDGSVIRHGFEVESVECFYEGCYEIIEATGHVFDDATVTVEPTCTTYGAVCKSCTVCGAPGYYICENDDLPKCVGSDYRNGMHETYTYTVEGYEWLVLNFSEESYLENGCDHIWIYKGAEIADEYLIGIYSGSELSNLAVTVGADTFTIVMITDGSVIRYGFEIESIECYNTEIYDLIAPLGHNYGEYVLALEPTCTEQGYYASVCANCGHTLYDYIGANGHTIGEWYVVLEPTCTEYGREEAACVDCGEIVTRDISPIGHSYSDWEIVEATCTEYGYEQRTCRNCGYVEEYQLYPTGHSWSETEVLLEATCTDYGADGHYCLNCGKEESYLTYPLGHSYSEWIVTVEPNCSTQGVEESYCDRCGHKGVSYMGYGEHVYVQGDVIVEATCTEQGECEYVCTACGNTYADVSPALGHDYVVESVIEYSCTENGSINYVCSRCGAGYSEIIPARHADIDGDGFCDFCRDPFVGILDLVLVIDTSGSMGDEIATVIENIIRYADVLAESGIPYYISIVDYRDFADRTGDYEDYAYSVIMDFSNINSEIAEGAGRLNLGYGGDELETAYSALMDGLDSLAWGQGTYKRVILIGDADPLDPEPYTGYTYEQVVQSLIDRGIMVYAVATEGQHLDTFEGIAGETGGRYYRCYYSEDFNQVILDVINDIPRDAHIHTYEESYSGNVCTETVTATYRCTGCGNVISAEIGPLGHDYSEEWIVDVAPTCADDGVESRHCSRCDSKTDERIIPALDGEHDYWYVDTEPTCQDDGYRLYTCNVCGHQYSEVISGPWGHDYIPYVYNATCTEGGYTEHICSRCGDRYTTDFTDPLGHEFEEFFMPPTCLSEGYTTYTCRICGYEYTEIIAGPTGHYFEENYVPATETEGGYIEYTCVHCGYSYREYIEDPIGHDYAIEVVPPTCTTQGYTIYVCSICGNTYTSDYVPAIDHSYVASGLITEATCTTPGSVGYVCEWCGDAYYSSDIAPLGHDYVIVDSADYSCTENGFVEYSCSRCGDTYTEIIPARHADIDGDGFCEFCDEPFVGILDLVLVIDTSGSMGDEIATVIENIIRYADVLAESGIPYYISIVDYRDFADRTGDSRDYAYSVIMDFSNVNSEIASGAGRLDLGYGGDNDETVYSALMDGLEELAWGESTYKRVILIGDAEPLSPEPYTEYTYSQVCQSLIDRGIMVYSVATDGEHLSSFEGIANETGGRYYMCNYSEDFNQVILDVINDIPRDAHIHTYEESYEGNVCTEHGTKIFTCTGCGNVITSETAPLGHDYSEEWIVDVEPTCESEGMESRHCSRCDSKIDQRIIPARHVDIEGDGFCDHCKKPFVGILDLVFVIDTSGSMDHEIAIIIENIIRYADVLAESGIPYYISIVDYRDFADRTGDSRDYAYSVIMDFSNVNSEIASGAGRLTLGNGGDTPETVYSALTDGLDHLAWGKGTYKRVILIGDAEPLSPEPYTDYTYAQVLQSLLDRGVMVYSVATDGKDLSTFEDLADATGGRYYRCYYSEDFNQVILDVINDIPKDAHIHTYEESYEGNVCTGVGTKIFTCTGCGNVITTEAGPLGHTEGDWVVVKLATATEEGLRAKYCTVCGEELATEIIPVIVIDDPYGYDPDGTNTILVIPECTTPEELSCHYLALGVESIEMSFAEEVSHEFVGTGTRVYLDGAEYRVVVKGDFDGNGKINMVDMFNMKIVLKQIGEPDALQSMALDLTGEGKINAIDAFNLRYRIAYGSWRG